MRRDLLQRGYQLVRVLQVDGIPYLFAEREVLTVLGVSPTPLTGYTMSYALSLDDGAELSQDCDRKSGFAAASEVRYLLGRDVLEAEGLAEALFATPTMRATLTTSVTSPSTTTFVVDSTSGWPASGSAYIGREYFTYTGTTGTSYTGITRGVAGLAHYHTADTASAYADVTDKPRYWRGRLVTVWCHLVSPEGRYLGTDWCTLGDYCWQEWRGEIVEVPQPTRSGFALRVGSLVQKLAGKVGATIKGKVASDSSGTPLIYATPSDSIRIVEQGGGLDVEGALSNTAGVMTLTNWCAIVQINLNAGAGSDEVFVRQQGQDRVRIGVTRTGSPFLSDVTTTAWFLEQSLEVLNSEAAVSFACIWRLDEVASRTGIWIVVELEPSADFTDAVPPGSGLLLVRSGGDVEVMRYDTTDTGWDGRFTAFRIVERRVNQTTGVNPFTEGAEVSIISAADGPVYFVAAALWCSSGMAGARGTPDTLGFGFGMGVPYDWFDEITFSRWFFEYINGHVAEEVAVEDVAGGHFALARQCLVQTTDDTGEHLVRLISTEVTDDPEAPALTAADVLLDGSSDPEQLEAPNHIVVDSSAPGSEGAKYVVRDASRSQAEGKVSWDMKAPGITLARALERGAMLILLSDGQQAMKVRLPPWSTVQIGDAISDQRAHPAVYDYTLGQWAPTAIAGRVVGLTVSQWDETREATILLAGQYGNTVYLAPSSEVTNAISTTVLRVSKGTVSRFHVGDAVAIYLPGSEATDYEEHDIATIDTTNLSYDVITLATPLAVVTPAAGLVVTFPAWANASTNQRRYMYARDERSWS